LPALGGFAAGIIGKIVQRSRSGQGVGDVMEAVVLGRVQLSMRVTLLKSIASFCAITTGGSIGREGPLIQVGGAAGKLMGGWLGLSSRRIRTLIAAGAAAGFAAAYNTPFAAVLFVLEVVLGVVVLEAVVPTLAATVLATAITRAVVGAGPIYRERAFSLRSPLELVAFAGLGLVAALGAQAFMRLLAFGERCFRRPNLPLPFRPALGGLLAGTVLTVLPEVAGNGYEPLNTLLDGRLTFGFVLLLLLAKCWATTASVASGSPGGVFTPTLLLGGALGFLYFGFLQRVGGLALGQAGGYALVGMAAATAATTHAPLMAAVMAFELSGDYAVVLPLLLATAVATAISRRIRKDSIYTTELRRRGVGWELTLEGRRLTS
jgi:CIC family chloride channel protein